MQERYIPRGEMYSESGTNASFRRLTIFIGSRSTPGRIIWRTVYHGGIADRKYSGDI